MGYMNAANNLILRASIASKQVSIKESYQLHILPTHNKVSYHILL
jgi:hypothetical protein